MLEDTAVALSSELERLHGQVEKRTGELERMALSDVLTGLANRRMFIEQLKAVIKNSQEHHERFAVVFIDLDNFKRINDTLGHDVGDELLIEVSRRLKASVRSTDVVARLGGDEFTLLMAQLTNVEFAKLAIEKILEQFQEPIHLKTGEYKITPSIGVAIGPDHGLASDQLMRCADIAMYKSKQNGKNCYFFYSAEMRDAMQNEMVLESELMEAIDSREFGFFYQPIIDMNTSEVVGLEALLRWFHPRRGVLSPIHFIHALENNGQIVPLGAQLFDTACECVTRLNRQGLGNIKISLNISAKQFNDPQLLEKFKTVLQKYKVKPSSFQLEIIEQTLMSNIDKKVALLQSFQDFGFQIAIDDFGTGYSSLAYLKKLPLDVLKIDRSFIKDIPQEKQDMEIVSAVTAMAKKLDLKVVAEGIETHEQHAFLKSIDCEFGQGFLYEKPKPIEELIDYLKGNSL